MKFPLPFEFSVQRLQANLDMVRDDEWIAHYNPDDHAGRWEVAALMAPAGMQTNIWSCSFPNICEPTPLLKRCDYFRAVIDQIPVQKSTVRLMQLHAGAVIKEHCDSFGVEEIRIHIPVTTSPEVEFYLAGERLDMSAGSCWFLDVRQPHRVANNGNESRIHLVIDAYRNNWFSKHEEAHRGGTVEV